MLDATLAWFWPDGMADLTHHKGEIVTHRPCDLYQLVDTLDGQLVYFLASQSQFEGMWRALGRDDLLADENFCNPGLLTRNRGCHRGAGRDPHRPRSDDHRAGGRGTRRAQRAGRAEY